MLARELIERLAAHAMHDFAEELVVDVGVAEDGAGALQNLFIEDSAPRFIESAPLVREREIGTQSRRVGEQMTDRDFVAPAAGEFGDVRFDRRVERDLSLLNQQPDRRRGRGDLRDRRRIVDRVFRIFLDRGNERAIAVGAGVRNAVALDPSTPPGIR